MFQKVTESDFISGEHAVLSLWQKRDVFGQLRNKNAGKPKWSFLDGPITANNPMGVHHAWGRTYKDAYQRYFAMTGHELRYQNGFDCQGLWVEVEVEKELGLGTKTAIHEYGIDKFVNACKRRVLKFAARQTEQSVRLGYWMEWDKPEELRKLAESVGSDGTIEYTTAREQQVSDTPHQIVARLGNPEWGGSYFTFSTENNETIWTFLKKCFKREKVYRGHDVMPWSGRGGSAYSQMEIADGRKLTTHRSLFVRFPLIERENEYLLIWTTTPWTLTSNVAAAVNPDLDYVKIKTKRDGSVYYFAKDNLNFKRLEREFKEGFGRPEWSWPEGVPKLKTLAQMFKEQGGFEEEGTVKGSEMVGWKYSGPFDELPAQQQPGGYPVEEHLTEKTGVSCHQVIDGGRDSKGSPHVVAGEGTGIVHIAPGCGDIDHKIGRELGLVGIAPLGEDGRFQDGFGEFTGREAIDPATVDLVLEKLKENHRLVAVEEYPHIYPHCWRTGDELVFRLVDEWFIDMDWREEIKDVTKSIEWLPESIDGQNREVEWLTNMRDWMISKKRFWGLALPIWVNPDDPTDFDVIGSLAELKERAVEGWNDFDGNTPHRPWIDGVKIKSEKTGAILNRIEDVGNPWLDAGITPFSTMGYNHNRDTWNEWFPADFVTECFPGQFRNWFYSLLALATMMRHDETDDPMLKRPFKTLLGHRLVMNEEGQPMHKSDGTAIWFEEAAEQLGVDTLRWLYLGQNPASDLRFGTRHPDDHVTLSTPEGPISETKEGMPTCKVTSKPADEIRRQFLIPLWNSYAFFVNYARLDEFDPQAAKVPCGERPEIDRWILSRLQSLIQTAHEAFPAFDVANFVNSAGDFIDDLSNWYIRRNRRRFWRSKDTNDSDKLAAYQTLYETLVTLTQLLAPVIPFLAERMYQNLVFGQDLLQSEEAGSESGDSPASVHLCDYPTVNEELLDPVLNHRTAIAQRIVKLGHQVREQSNLRVRQPLAEIRVACSGEEDRAAVDQFADVIADELNIKQIVSVDNLDGIVQYSFKPNLKTLGPKYGKLLGALRQQIPALPAETLAPLRVGKAVSLEVNGETIELEPNDVLVSTEQSSEWGTSDEAGVQVAISTQLTDELRQEGMARDFVRQIQQARKDADFEIEDRITIQYYASDADVQTAVTTWSDYICNETLATELKSVGAAADEMQSATVGDQELNFSVIRSN
ncbi:class I tRNA ligase family protein [Rubinisphaera brasiliensis]|uniref:Isoleucine--tRNA ligase n=1 Tax=Rubinisphaera brasiliensis (strain ATCC 49424 / DSM 5305 / JCM 21570 / IAM 15109 / NBRC 103401 / IFAM 1448) TaxID=756272 RepID=F0SP34_RUBBR|nr:class I tRNA ligase family protein [Rubinisphaera brasiliensis]ADY61137.1 Isoleucine--tRNA ligase [Rubinisphaera brasiliensis DSM 5305]